MFNDNDTYGDLVSASPNPPNVFWEVKTGVKLSLESGKNGPLVLAS